MNTEVKAIYISHFKELAVSGRYVRDILIAEDEDYINNAREILTKCSTGFKYNKEITLSFIRLNQNGLNNMSKKRSG